MKRRQICIIDLEQELVTSTVIAGNGNAKRAYGLSLKNSFGRPSAMACEGKSIFVCDTGANAVTPVTPLEPLAIICQQLELLYDAFRIHMHVPKNHPRKNVPQAIPVLENVLNVLESNANRVKKPSSYHAKP